MSVRYFTAIIEAGKSGYGVSLPLIQATLR